MLLALIFTTGLWTGKQLEATTKREPPTAHEGVSVASLGSVGSESMQNTLDLTGYKLQMREIGLLPGGKIAKHDHKNRPGLVWMIEGSWTEGREAGETTISAGSEQNSLIEDENTTHWFFNDSNKLARAIVCDIVPDTK